MTPEQQLEYDVFVLNNPGDEGRASQALGFDTSGPRADAAPGNTDPGNWDVGAARGDEAPGVNAMIGRDQASWEQSLRAAARQAGVPYDPSDLEGVIRQVSYAKNVGRDPGDFIKEAQATYGRRAQPTFSNGGRGGSADLNGDGVLDPQFQIPRGFGMAPPSALSRMTGLSGGTGNATNTGSSGSSAFSSGGPQSIQPFTGSVPALTAPDYPGFVAPTADDIFSDPGFAARLREGSKALQNSAAAKGSYFTPNTLRDLMEFNQDQASNEYGNVYDRKFGEWTAGLSRLQSQDQAAMGRTGLEQGIQTTNETNRFGSQRSNRLDDLTGLNADRGWDLSNRQFQQGVNNDLWNQNRQGYMDDFGIWRTMNTDLWGQQMDVAKLGSPR